MSRPNESQIAFSAGHVLASGEGALLPEPPVQQLRGVLGEEVLLRAAGDTGGRQAAAERLSAAALTRAHQVTHPRRQHPAIVALAPAPAPPNSRARGYSDPQAVNSGCAPNADSQDLPPPDRQHRARDQAPPAYSKPESR